MRGDWSKMRKQSAKTRQRQGEIKMIVKIIQTLDLQGQIMRMPRLLFDLGVANASESTYDALQSDFFFLNNVFC